MLSVRVNQEFKLELREDHNSHLATILSDPQFSIRRERTNGNGSRLQIDWGGQPIEHRKDILVSFFGATGTVNVALTIVNLAFFKDRNEDVVQKFDNAKLLFAAALKELNIASFDCRLIPLQGKYDMRIEVDNT